MKWFALLLLAYAAWPLNAAPLCAPLRADSYSSCLRESRDRQDRAACASLAEHDLREIEEWQSCQNEAATERAAKERDEIAAQAARLRLALVMRLKSNVAK